jgi:hypothetical protein
MTVLYNAEKYEDFKAYETRTGLYPNYPLNVRKSIR